MSKKERQQKLLEIIRLKRIASQHDLLAELLEVGVEANQASISRDLNELGVAKFHGVYALPRINPGESPLTNFLNIEAAGEHILVIRTDAGKAMAVGAVIDDLKLIEIVGTVAGDDTIFVATRIAAEQKTVMQKIMQALRHV